VPDPVAHVANGMRGGGKVARAEVVPNDPTADEICGFPDGLEQAKDHCASTAGRDFSRIAASAAAIEPRPTGTEVSLANE
jgi:hypothetical protein